MIGDLIFDLGMNNGDDTDFYLSKGFRVVAVEANPALCALARDRFAPALADRKLTIVNKAISPVSGEIDLFVNDQVSGWTTANPDWLDARLRAGAPGRRIRVPAATFGEIIQEFGLPYYVKADVQGAEIHCLKAMLELDEKPRFLSIASGAVTAGNQAMRVMQEEIRLLSELRYKRFQVVRQDQAELQTCPKPAREGRDVDYCFKHGMSGLFGRELPDRWISREDAMTECRKIARGYRFAGSSRNNDAWFTKLPSRTIRYWLDRVFWRGTTWYDIHARYS